MSFREMVDEVSKHPTGDSAPKRKGYTGMVEYKGKLHRVVDGRHDKAEGFFIEEDGTLSDKAGKVLGKVPKSKLKGDNPEPRAGGGPVDAGKAYMVGERGPEVVVPKAPGTVLASRTDAMSPADQAAYKAATGGSIDAQEHPAAAPPRADQGVVPIPPNIAGLAKVLLASGRAPNQRKALEMAIQMNAQRK